jgi:hypothetical protein
MSQHLSGIDLATIHNSFATLTQAYGQMLAEQERRQAMLTAQLKAATDENVKLRAALAAATQPAGSER